MTSVYLDKLLNTNPLVTFPLQEVAGTVVNAVPDPLYNGIYKGSWILGHPGINTDDFSALGNGTDTGINALTAAYTTAFPTLKVAGSFGIWAQITNPADWDVGLDFSLMNTSQTSSNAITLRDAFNGVSNDLQVQSIRAGVVKTISLVKKSGWVFYVLTWDEVASQLKAYQNGALVSTQSAIGNFAGTATVLAIGSRIATVTAFGCFPGAIAYPTFWSRVLTAPEIADLYVIPEVHPMPSLPYDNCWTGAEVNQLITPDGKIITLDGVDDISMPIPFDGQGLPPVEYVTQQGPQQHGKTVISYRLQPRLMQAVVRWNGRNRKMYWDLRSELLDLLRPNRIQVGSVPNKCQLRKIFPDFTIRDIDVLVDQGPNFSPGNGDWDEFSFEEAIRFIAHDPTFYDPNVETLSVSMSAIGQLSVPIHVPIHFGPGIQTVITPIAYVGTWLTYPVITMTGPLTAVIITNQTTGEEIQFTKQLGIGQRAVIDTRFGIKSVVDPDLPTTDPNYNLIGYVFGDLGTFHLDPAPQAVGGVNTVSIYIVSPGGSGSVAFEYNARYFGI